MAPTGSARPPRPPAGLRDIVARSTSPSPQSISPDRVYAALRTLPSHGWTTGWTGRRDRALLVLSQLAGLSFENIAELTVGDIAIADGVATITTPGGTTVLRRADDDLICGPCALARWVHALDLTSVYGNDRVIAAVIARSAPLTANSPHLCEGSVLVSEPTRQLPVLAASALRSPFPIAASTHTAAARPAAALDVLPLPTQRSTGTGPTGLVERGGSVAARSDYTRADRELSVAQADRLALGLQGRARQLLDLDSADATFV